MKPHARSRRGRIRRAAKWAGLVVCVVIAGVWAINYWWGFGYVRVARNGRVWVASCECGILGFAPQTEEVAIVPWGTANYIEGWKGSAGWYRCRNAHGYPVWRPRWIDGPWGTSCWLPLWMPLLTVASPTAWLWWRHRRAMRPGHCAACGYDLAGLASGATCPECGTAATACSARG